MASAQAPMFRGGCFCGAVKFEATAVPILRGLCHCTHCQRLNGAPAPAFVAFPVGGFKIIKGSDHLHSFDSSDHMVRHRCKTCGAPVYAEEKGVNPFADVPLTAFERDPQGQILHQDQLKPTIHINCDTEVKSIGATYQDPGLVRYIGMPGSATL